MTYCWAADNEMFYLATDTIVEGGLGAPAKRIGLYRGNLNSHEILYSVPKEENLYLIDIAYANFDSSVYVKNLTQTSNKVFKLDVSEKILIPTKYHGIQFS